MPKEPTTCIDPEKVTQLVRFLKGRVEQFEADAGKHALAALRAERMDTNPPDARKAREDALTANGHAAGLRDAINTIGLHLNV